jgi:tetratricopeptide (TPR) repeat protein
VAAEPCFSFRRLNLLRQPRAPQAQAYNSLAAALVRRARETSDVAYITQAGEAIKKSLELSPHDFEGEKLHASVLLALKEYPAALEQAKALNKRVADDVMVYGLLSEANAELGNYTEAEDAGQWMLNLRPGNVPGLLNAAYLREIFGDPSGAYEMLDLALQSTNPGETEARAWILTRMAQMRMVSGDLEATDILLRRAQDTFPNYVLARTTLAQLRVAQKRYPEAITLFKGCAEASPSAHSLYQLAVALELAGHINEAQNVFRNFELGAEAQSSSKDNANLELIFYYADRAHQTLKALHLAQHEIACRHDVYTLDAYAWALHINRQK